MIPLTDLRPEIALMRKELEDSFSRVLDHGQFIMGPEVRDLEMQVAEYLGAKHGIGVNSGTDALLIALRAAGIGAGDEVITTSFTFFATVESIEMAGAKPVMLDIDPVDYNIDPNHIEAAVTSRTKAIVPVHLFGKPAAMARIMEIAEKHNLLVIEDCAQSFGATYHGTCSGCDHSCSPEWRARLEGKQTGTIGIAGAFSFFPEKNLGALGDGGIIITDDDDLARKAAMLRVHGATVKYHNEVLGYNSRLDTMQAAFLLVKMKYITEFNNRRRALAHRYMEALSGLEGIRLPALPDEGHVYHLFTIQVTNMNRDDFAAKLREAGIMTMNFYPVPIHQLPVYNGKSGTLPVVEDLKDMVLSLPMNPTLSEEHQDEVIRVIKKLLR